MSVVGKVLVAVHVAVVRKEGGLVDTVGVEVNSAFARPL